jgi:hypothetical protein
MGHRPTAGNSPLEQPASWTVRRAPAAQTLTPDWGGIGGGSARLDLGLPASRSGLPPPRLRPILVSALRFGAQVRCPCRAFAKVAMNSAHLTDSGAIIESGPVVRGQAFSGAGGPSRMNRLRGTYTGYSIGCAIAWAVVLAVVAVTQPGRLHTYVLVCAGWLIGWISATIARSVYPPPKPKQSAT